MAELLNVLTKNRRVVLFLSLVLALSACGPADSGTTTSGEQAASAPDSEAPPAAIAEIAEASDATDPELLPHVFPGPSLVVDDLPADVKAFCTGYEQALQGNPYSSAEIDVDPVLLVQYLSWNLATREKLVAPQDIAADFDLLNANFQRLIDYVETNNATLQEFASLSEEDSAFFDRAIEQRFDDYWWGTCLNTESPYSAG